MKATPILNFEKMTFMSDLPRYSYLTKIDPNANQYRYYSLRVDPDLFGRWSLCREWGRLDTNGGVVRIDSFESEVEAMSCLVRITQQKQKRGYQQR